MSSTTQPRRWGALAAVMLGIAVAALLAEVVLRLAFPLEFFLDPRTDAYWRTMFSNKPVLARDVEPDPVLGWRMRRNYSVDGVTHDARGFRVTPRFEAQGGARPGTIVLLGDSFTYGFGVRDEETYGARLAARLPGWTVINTAANASGLDQQLLMWETEGAALRPDIVVVGYFVDDFLRNGLSFRDSAKPYFVPEGEGLRLHGLRAPSLQETATTAANSSEVGSRLLAALEWGRRRVTQKLEGGEPAETFDARRKVSDRLLARLATSVRGTGATLVVLAIPHCSYQAHFEARRIEEAIAHGCSASSIDCTSPTELCMKAEARGAHVFGDNCHWSAAGHDVVAGFLADHLRELGAVR